ncbi:MAG: DUF4252 domain-containing protein [Paludibacter sp.]|jgi:hypothetical protein|nr:DUF4252 domain-containing protein [Paludibacter sp.]
MKRLFLTTALFTTLFFGIQAQSNMFQRLGNNKDVSVVYISKALLSLAGSIPIGDADISGLMDKLEGIEIYSSETPAAIKFIKSEFNKLTTEKSELEVLMKAKEGEQHFDFFARKGKDGKILELVMFSDEPNECSVIRISGHFAMEDIEKITKKMK